MIYLDNNATTKMDDEVLEAMRPYFSECYGNPSNNRNWFCKRAESAIENALYELKDLFQSKSINDFIITSGATESNNLAITGLLSSEQASKKPRHIIISCIEHPSVLQVCKFWESKNVECTYLPVNKDGIVSIEMLEKSIRDNTYLISIMSANNEIGTIQPVKEIAWLAKKHGIIFHTDATQYLYHEFLNVQEIPVDMISFSGHKLHGPKGVGGLFVNQETRKKINPMLLGGGQQRNFRSGTWNVPGVIGMAKAMTALKANQKDINERMLYLRELLLKELSAKTEVHVNGSLKTRLSGNLNMYFPNVAATALIDQMQDIIFSTGSACSSHSRDRESYVLQRIGLNSDEIKASFRLGLSKYTTEEEIYSVAEEMLWVIDKSRKR